MSDISSVTSTTPATSTTSAASTNEASQLADPQMFLQLLVAELQNQDPTNPTDPSTIMQQSATLAQVESMNTMTSAISADQNASQDNEATGLIGKTITAKVSGQTVTGAVASIQLSSTGAPSLTVNGTTIPLSSVTTVS